MKAIAKNVIVKNVITIVIVVAIGILIGKYLLSDDEDLKKARDKIARTMTTLDSLENVKARIAAELTLVKMKNDSLEQKTKKFEQKVTLARGRLTKNIKEVNIYEGTKSDLLHDLNLILDAPIDTLSN